MKSSMTYRDLKKVFWALRGLWLRFQYFLTLHRLRKIYGHQKLKVGFFVSELAKWKGQSLYDLLDGSDRFEPVMLVYPMGVETGDIQSAQMKALADKIAFFSQKGMNVRSIWSIQEQKCIPADIGDIDICFYQQPWDTPPAPIPHQIASRTLTFYFPYFVANYNNPNEINQIFHFELFRHIMLNNEQIRIYGRKRSGLKYCGKMVALGHPQLDLLNPRNNHAKGQYVIYAPHFSFPVENVKRTLPISTFLDNGRMMLDFARNHPEIQWAFKPHPRLRRELVDTHTWTKEEVDAYYSAWEDIGAACYTSDYIELFSNSRALITDCASFLPEYSSTGKPLIHLIPERLPVPPNPAMEGLFGLFYQAPNKESLEKWLKLIVLEGCDPRKDERVRCLKNAGLLDSHAAENIMEYMDKLLR